MSPFAPPNGTETDGGPGEADSDSDSDFESDVIGTTATSLDDRGFESDSGSIAVDSDGSVLGGYESTSFRDPDAESSATTTETDTNTDRDTSTETDGEGGDAETTTLTSSESDAATSTETASDTATETETSSLTMGAAGVVLSGGDYGYESDDGTVLEDGTDTGSSTLQETDVSSEDVGGNTASDSVSTSESDASSGTDGGRDTDWLTTTEHTAYGPGELVVGGDASDSGTDIDSSTETLHDSSSGTDTSTEGDSQAEAADSTTDSLGTTGTDSGTVDETISDFATAFEQDSDILAAAGDVLGGFSSSTESDTGRDDTTDAETSTETTTETDSAGDMASGETTTEQETDTATETDVTTDTEDDAPTDWEESSESFGVAGLVLGGSSSATMNDTATDDETTSDVDVDMDTQTESDREGDSLSSLDDHDQGTATDTGTLTGTDDSTDTDYEASGETLGLAGVALGGSEQDTETGSDTGGSTTTADDVEDDTATEVTVEDDTGDSSTDSTSEVDSETIGSTDPEAEDSTSWESMTETLGAGGVVIGGSLSETYAETGGMTLGPDGTDTVGLTATTTEADSVSEHFDDTSVDAAGSDPEVGQEAGSDTTTDLETGSSGATGTLSEELGADGTIVAGAESDSLSESSGETTTEVDHPVETVTASASDATMTLTETVTNTDTANESDQEWACETLGTSGTISGGSDCFTVSSLETSGYSSSGSGPEDYNDTSGTPDGTATVTASGSSSELLYQEFGDVLGTGGDIASGGLSYTVTSSETDAATTLETGTDTLGSYGVTATMPDAATDWETGSEALGGGGTVSTGTASFSWSDGDSESRHLTDSGHSTTLDIAEDSTDTYGFGESGTETITTGGADSAGSASFAWDQMGTDHYRVTDDGTTTLSSTASSTWSSDGMTMTNTVSSSWHDAGAVSLGSDDAVAGETDTYSWTSFQSLADDVADVEARVSGESYTYTYYEYDPTLHALTSSVYLFAVDSGSTDFFADDGVQSTSDADSGCDTLEADPSGGGGLTVVGGSNTYAESEYAEHEPTLQDVGSAFFVGTLDPYIAAVVTEYGQNDSSEHDSYSSNHTESGWTILSGPVEIVSFTDSIDQTLANFESWSDSDSLTDEANGFWSSGGTTGGDTNSDSIQDQDSDYQTYVSGIPTGYQASDSYADLSWNTYTDDDATTGYGYWGESNDGAGGAAYPYSYPWQGSTSSNDEQTLSQGGTSTHDLDGGYNYSDTEITLVNAADLDSGGAAGPGGDDAGARGGYSDLDYWEIQNSPLSTIETGDDGSDSSTTAGDQPSYSTYFSDSETWYSDSGTSPPPYTELEPSNPFISMPSDALGAVSELESDGGFAGLGADLINPGSYYPRPGSPLVFKPDTSNMTPTGQPTQALAGLGLRFNDGVSRSAPPSPTAALIALAAAGRDPADLTIPTAGSQSAGTGGTGSGGGTGGAGSGSGSAMAMAAAAGPAAGSGVAVAQGALTIAAGAGTGGGTAYDAGGAGGTVQADDGPGGQAPESHETPAPAFRQQSEEQALAGAAADARGMDAMGLPIRMGPDTMYMPGMGVYYVGPKGPPGGAQAPVGIPAGYDWDADVESYQQFSNPFLSAESSQTHPNDTGLHYGMQGANIVAAAADFMASASAFMLGRAGLNSLRAARGLEAAERSAEAAEALRGAEMGGQAARAAEGAAAAEAAAEVAPTNAGIAGSTADFELFVQENKGILANLDKEGLVEFKINTQGSGVRGTDLFKQMMQHFGDNAKGVWGKWVSGTNLEKVNELTAQGVPLEEAITRTWTANRAREFGFGNATIVGEPVGVPGAYTNITVKFTR